MSALRKRAACRFSIAFRLALRASSPDESSALVASAGEIVGGATLSTFKRSRRSRSTKRPRSFSYSSSLPRRKISRPKARPRSAVPRASPSRAAASRALARLARRRLRIRIHTDAIETHARTIDARTIVRIHLARTDHRARAIVRLTRRPSSSSLDRYPAPFAFARDGTPLPPPSPSSPVVLVTVLVVVARVTPVVARRRHHPHRHHPHRPSIALVALDRSSTRLVTARGSLISPTTSWGK